MNAQPNRREFFTPANLFASATALEGCGLPEIIDIEPIHTCNLRCVMCHVSYENLTKVAIDVDALRRSVQGMAGRWAVVGATHEPLMHPKFEEIVELLTEAGLKIDLTTNGSLFTDHLIERVRHGNFRNVTVSFDGARKETYEKIRRGGDFRRTLDRVAAFREVVGNAQTYYGVNYTVTRSTLPELAEAIDLWDGMGFDHVGFIAMVARNAHEDVEAERIDTLHDEYRANLVAAAEGVIHGYKRISISSSVFTKSGLAARYPMNVRDNIVISDNPDALLSFNCRPHFQNGYHPEVSVACRSPYKHVRILFNGNVMICNEKQIGNINEASLKDIWFGEAANRQRMSVRESRETCEACNFYRFCIKAGEIDIEAEANWKSY